MKTNNYKENNIKRRLTYKNFIATSDKTVKWCKNYLTRSERRRAKQETEKELKEYDEN
jgi:hypothetical protein